MALEGKIREFGVADIIQLISQQQKTGILLLDNNDQKAEICFAEGQITGSKGPGLLSRDPVGEIVVRAGLVSEVDLKAALEKQKKTFAYLGQILLKQGLVTEEQLERAIITQTFETFYDVLQWRDGVYRFTPQKVSPAANQPPLPGLESILLEVFRMIDEWPEVEKNVPAFDTVPERIPEGEPAGGDEDRMLVYGLVDGASTIQQIIDKSLLGRFNACKILAGLLKEGCIQSSSSSAPGREDGDSRTVQHMVAAAAFAAVPLVLAGLLVLPTQFPVNILPAAFPTILGASYFQEFFDQEMMTRMKRALEMYRLRFGSYPDSIYDLASTGIMSDNELAAFGRRKIIYARASDSYTLQHAR